MNSNKLKIAQLVLPWIPLPPPGYAGTERVVYSLIEGLVKRGHEVTLFSVGESKTSAKLEYIFPKALGLQKDVIAFLKGSFYPLMHVANCFEKQDRFDIIHSHAQFLALPFAAVSRTTSLHTFHRVFQFTNQDDKDLVLRYKHLNFTSISNAQRESDLNFVATVYNGVDTDVYTPVKNPARDFIFWAGRLIDKKGPLEAIEVAKKLNIKLFLAGTVTDEEYYKNNIEKKIDGVNIKYLGDLSEKDMVFFYQNALCTLFPVKWNEPFGLIPVESMACTTPVVAYANGGVSETIPADGSCGFSVKETEGVKGLIEKVKVIKSLSNKSYQEMAVKARKHVENNFSVARMVEDYEKVYYKLSGVRI